MMKYTFTEEECNDVLLEAIADIYANKPQWFRLSIHASVDELPEITVDYGYRPLKVYGVEGEDE